MKEEANLSKEFCRINWYVLSKNRAMFASNATSSSVESVKRSISLNFSKACSTPMSLKNFGISWGIAGRFCWGRFGWGTLTISSNWVRVILFCSTGSLLAMTIWEEKERKGMERKGCWQEWQIIPTKENFQFKFKFKPWFCCYFFFFEMKKAKPQGFLDASSTNES